VEETVSGKKYIAVIDAGTSSVRASVLDQSGKTVSERACPWRHLELPDAPPTTREFDSAGVWKDVRAILGGALQEAGAGPDEVAAVTVTGQRQGVVFLANDGTEIYAGPNTDLRAIFEGLAIDHSMGERVYQTTGHYPSFMMAPAKLHWFRQSRPEVYGRIATVLTLADWLVWKLSGVRASEASLASEAGLLHVHWRSWCEKLLHDLRVVCNSHIPVLESGTIAGGVTAEAAEATGLAEGTPVAVAAADSQCGLIGMGVIEPGHAGVVAGWSAAVQMVTDRPVLNPSEKTWAGCFPLPDRWVCENPAGDTGNSYAWLADLAWRGRGDPYKEMEEAARQAPAGANGTLAYLGIARMDMTRLGMRQGGILFPTPLTYAEAGSGAIARAAIESSVYTVASSLYKAEAVTGRKARSVSAGGGMTLTALWSETLANVLGRPLKTAGARRVSAYGAYLCAAKAVGWIGDWQEAAEKARSGMATIVPDALSAAEYADHYKRWVEVDEHLQGLMK